MINDLLYGLAQLCVSGFFFWRIIFKKENNASTGMAAMFFLIAGFLTLKPFLATVLARLCFGVN